MKIFQMLFLVSVIIIFSTCNDDNTTNPDNPTDSVKIGNQVWMCRNLDVDRYRNGDLIPEVKDQTEWVKLTTGAWCYYNNDTALGKIYGKLYNWYAVNDSRGLAPFGSHIPTDAEWTELTSYLGGEKIAGGKLKETGKVHWLSPNTGATNSSGFFALPGGWRNSAFGYFTDIGNSGYWWSASESNSTNAMYRRLFFDGATISRYSINKGNGYSVRCIRD